MKRPDAATAAPAWPSVGTVNIQSAAAAQPTAAITNTLVEAGQLFKDHKSAAIVGAIVAGMLLAEGRRRP